MSNLLETAARRLTIQQIGCWTPVSLPQMAHSSLTLVVGDTPEDIPARVKEKGYGHFDRQDDWSSCAWFCLDQPSIELPELPPVEQRIAGLV